MILRRALRLLAGAAILSAVVLLPVPTMAGTAPTISVSLTDPRVGGTASPSAIVEVTVREAGGQLRAKVTTTAGKRGGFAAHIGAPPLPGDRVTVRSGGIRRALTVPDIRPVVDRERDVVRGSAAPGTEVLIRVLQGILCCGPGVLAERTVVAGPGGVYRADFSDEVDIVGPNQATVQLAIGPHRVRALGAAPWLNLNHDETLFQGQSLPGTAFRLELRAPDGTLRIRVRILPVPFDPSFAGHWRDSRGDPVYPRPGDTIHRTGLPPLVYPDFRMRADPATDEMRGRCVPDASVEIWVADAERVLPTDGQGRFAVDLSAAGGFRPGAFWTALCTWPSGDRYVATGIAR